MSMLYAGAAGDDDAADIGIVLRGVGKPFHRAIHVLRDGVLFFRPPQRDHPRCVFVGDYEVPGHDRVLKTTARFGRQVFSCILHDPQRSQSG